MTGRLEGGPSVDDVEITRQVQERGFRQLKKEDQDNLQNKRKLSMHEEALEELSEDQKKSIEYSKLEFKLQFGLKKIFAAFSGPDMWDSHSWGTDTQGTEIRGTNVWHEIYKKRTYEEIVEETPVVFNRLKDKDKREIEDAYNDWILDDGNAINILKKDTLKKEIAKGIQERGYTLMYTEGYKKWLSQGDSLKEEGLEKVTEA